VLSTRADLIPPEVAVDLEALRDRVPPVPTERILEVMAAELGRPPGDVFAEFDPIPLAAASIGQVRTLADYLSDTVLDHETLSTAYILDALASLDITLVGVGDSTLISVCRACARSSGPD
jgi:hypothetical protein